jgi:hypothetical protein
MLLLVVLASLLQALLLEVLPLFLKAMLLLGLPLFLQAMWLLVLPLFLQALLLLVLLLQVVLPQRLPSRLLLLQWCCAVLTEMRVLMRLQPAGKPWPAAAAAAAAVAACTMLTVSSSWVALLGQQQELQLSLPGRISSLLQCRGSAGTSCSCCC